MKNRFLTLDYVILVQPSSCAIWLACWALIKRKEFFRHWKVFGYYLFYMAGASIFMLAIARFGSRGAFILGLLRC